MSNIKLRSLLDEPDINKAAAFQVIRQTPQSITIKVISKPADKSIKEIIDEKYPNNNGYSIHVDRTVVTVFFKES